MPENIRGFFDIVSAWWGTLAVAVAAAFGYGKMAGRVSDHNKKLYDSDGNERYITTGQHKDICRLSHSSLEVEIKALREEVKIYHEGVLYLTGEMSKNNQALYTLIGQFQEAGKFKKGET